MVQEQILGKKRTRKIEQAKQSLYLFIGLGTLFLWGLFS